MRLALSSDHAGYELKRDLAAILGQKGHAVLDLGTHSTAPCDYPDAAESVAEALRNGDAERGIIVCGSGAGVSIAANKFPGIRRHLTNAIGRVYKDLDVSFRSFPDDAL